MKKKLIHKIILMMLILINASCVGTINNKNSLKSLSINGESEPGIEQFQGLLSATAIAHDKVELVFTPVEDAGPEEINYSIYTDNSDYPYVVSGSTLETSKTAEGNYLYTVKDLSIATRYEFNIKASLIKDATKTTRLDPLRAKSAITFANETASFNGVSGLELGIGNRSMDTVFVKWIPAEIKGTNLNIKPNDPIAYEITYWAKGIPKVSQQFPNTIANPTLSKSTGETVGDLAPGTTYYFQVRSIHKKYATEIGQNVTYKREENNKVLKITTAKEVDHNLKFVGFNELAVSNPIEKRGRTEVDLHWYAAWGNEGMFYYKLAVLKLANGAISNIDKIGDYDSVKKNADIHTIDISPDNVEYIVKSLDAKEWYQFKVFACRSFTNGDEDECPIYTPTKTIDVKAKMVSFSGILSIANPDDVDHLNKIALSFEPVDVSSGYLDKFILTCYESSAAGARNLVLSNAGTTSNSTITNCHNLKIDTTSTPLPVTISQYGTFKKLIVGLDQDVTTTVGKTYCFSMSPAISYADLPLPLADDKLADPLIKCIAPKISAPTVEEFPGRDPGCSVSSNSITTSWPNPTGGVYSNFVVFYKEKSSSDDYFNFADAVVAYNSNNTTVYKFQKVSKDTSYYKIENLNEGSEYFVGVLALAYKASPLINQFSKYNSNTGSCKIASPSPIFSEWVDLLALGPKVDGLLDSVDRGANALEMRLFETFSDDNQPLEVNPASSTLKTTAKEFLSGVARTTSEEGVFSKSSNQGMIRLVWSDVTMTNGKYLNEFIKLDDPSNSKARSARKYGYKIYRSDDNRQSWTDLTKTGPIYPYNIYTNTTTATSYKKSGGVQTPVVQQLVRFDDYTVSSQADQSSYEISGISKAKIYWYKVAVFFNGKEVAYNTATTNPEHHILRVTLPPRNMALVHRQIANRATCLELDKTINKKAGAHYSCAYNGIGATGLDKPWQKGNTVYDLGGDLLVDRFELGCAFSRGAQSGESIAIAGEDIDEKDMSEFKGCVNSSVDSYLPYSTAKVNVGGDYRKILPGDCFGNDEIILVNLFSKTLNECEANNNISSLYISLFHNLMFPGSKHDISGGLPTTNFVSCSSLHEESQGFPSSLSQFFGSSGMKNYVTQGDFGAFYYSRKQFKESIGTLGLEYDAPVVAGEKVGNTPVARKSIRGANLASNDWKNSSRRGSSCQANLSYINASGDYVPRWIPINYLISGVGVGKFDANNNVLSNTKKVLYNKKFSELESDLDLYGADYKFPGTQSLVTTSDKYKNLPIISVGVKNNSKLPPLDGVSQDDMAKICAENKVQVGIEKEGKNFVPTSAILSKRLLRKKEFNVSASWPTHFMESMITNIENGATTGSCNSANKFTTIIPHDSLTFKSNNKYTPMFPQPFISGETDNKETTAALMLTGSSALDSTNANYHTEKCISRFGIQDLVGNVGENVSEEIFCDFRNEYGAKMMIGDYNYTNGSTSNDSLFATISMPYTGGTYYNATTQVGGNTLAAKGLRVKLVTAYMDNSGSCSIVDKYFSNSNYLTGINFNPTIKQDGSLNKSIILDEKKNDQASIDTLRNGDGSFLTFGKDRLAPPIDKQDSLAIGTETYFNPVVGLPMKCGTAANCSSNTDNQINKNTIVLGNSDVTNDGVAQFETTGPVRLVDMSVVHIKYLDLLDVSILKDLDDLGKKNYVYKYSDDGSVQPDSTDVARYSRWSIGRAEDGLSGNTVRMIAGGSSLEDKAGRFSSHLEGRSEERFNYYRNAGRCAVMINNE